jgi:hypothetical protein
MKASREDEARRGIVVCPHDSAPSPRTVETIFCGDTSPSVLSLALLALARLDPLARTTAVRVGRSCRSRVKEAS